MSKFKGTPGPWEAINEVDVFTRPGSKNGSVASADVSDGWYVADCNMGETMTPDGYQSIPFAEQKANARLIAAAPELLEALNLVLDNCLDSGGLAAAHAKARAAIVKATGDAQ